MINRLYNKNDDDTDKCYDENNANAIIGGAAASENNDYANDQLFWK